MVRRDQVESDLTVQSKDHLLIPPKGTYVQLVADDETVSTIPLLTMTAVEYSPQGTVAN